MSMEIYSPMRFLTMEPESAKEDNNNKYYY